MYDMIKRDFPRFLKKSAQFALYKIKVGLVQPPSTDVIYLIGENDMQLGIRLPIDKGNTTSKLLQVNRKY